MNKIATRNSGGAAMLRRSHRFQSVVCLLLLLSLCPFQVRANPSGASVVAGNVNFGGMGTARLDINNLTNGGNGRTIINWQSFSIQQGEVTSVNQGANGFTLNRIVSGNPTAIHGQLKAAQGGVAVINPNGIVVHQGGSVDVAGILTLSTLDVSNKDFLNGGAMRFRGTTAAGVRNYGAVSSSDGDVVLLGNFLQNAGSVAAPKGVVAFGAGGDIVVDQAGGAKISVLAGGSGGATGIDNSGTIDAAAAELKAHGNVYALAIKNDGLVRANGYNFSSGRLTLSAGPQGRIVNTGQLSARRSDGSGGQVNVSGGRVQIGGSVDASGEVGRAGGSVTVSGSSVEVAAGAVVNTNGATGGTLSIHAADEAVVGGQLRSVGETGVGGQVKVEATRIAVGNGAVVDVSGATGGGSAKIGGGFQGRDESIRNAEELDVEEGALIIADAVEDGSGGIVILWSDGDTLFEGDLSARGVCKGGFAEISGKRTLSVSGNIDLRATEGAAGTLLLDPTNVMVSALGGGVGDAWDGTTSAISNRWLSQHLDMGNNVIISTNFGGAERGDITIGRATSALNAKNDKVEWYQNDANTVGGTLTLLAMGDIHFHTSVHSAGAGGINVVAGWDGSTGFSATPDPGTGLVTFSFNMQDILATMNDGNAANDAAGLRSGSVHIGITGTPIGVDVGSRWGDTNVAARDLFLTGSTTYAHGWAQLGFHDSGYEYGLGTALNTVQNEWWGNAAGNVLGKDYIALLGGTEFGTGGTPGVAGAFRGAGWGATGNIEAGLSGRLQMLGGTSYSSTQIGHGANVGEGTEPHYSGASPSIRTTRDGIVVDPNRDRSSFFSSTWRTNYAGGLARIHAKITVTADGDILMMGGPGFDAAGMLSASRPTGTFSLIGHGGAENTGSYHGDITVTAHGTTPRGYARGPEGIGIQMLGGPGSRSFVQIGHATDNQGAYGNVWDMTRSGDIIVTATTGAIRAEAHNQVIRDGDVNFGTPIPDDQVVPVGNVSDNTYYGSYVHIGHGGQNAGGPSTVGRFTMPGGSVVGNIMPDNSTTGDITVYAGGTYTSPTDPGNRIGIMLRAGTGLRTHAMIGHGGNYMYATNTADQTPNFGAGAATPFGTPTLAASTGFIGKVHVEADTGDLVVQGGDNTRPSTTSGYRYAYAKIGHGGYVTKGAKDGTITVLAGQGAGAVGGNIRFRAGGMEDGFAQLGHGGYDSDGDILGSDNSAEIVVTARGGISFVSPEGGPTDGVLSGDWEGTYNASPFGVGRRWIMLGHGGYAATTVMPGRQDITVTSGTGDVGNADGNKETGGILFVAGDTDFSFAQLGHGGYSSSANNEYGFTGDIVIRALGGGIRFDGSVIGAQTSASTTASLNGATAETVTKGVGQGRYSYAQLGHGGHGSRGVHSGTIDIETWGGVEFLGAAASPITQRTVTTAPIDAALKAGTNVWVILADLRTTATGRQMPGIYANIVPGTVEIVLRDASGNVVDTITDVPGEGTGLTAVLVRASDGATVGEVDYDDGQVRFTGSDYTGSWAGTGATTTYGSIEGNKLYSYVQLGHGGFDADGPDNKAADQPGNSGDILVHAAGDIRFQGGSSYLNYAQLGHGGYANKGAHSGNIIIDHIDPGNPLGEVGGLHFIAGHGGHRQYDLYSYVQLGHGGLDADGNHFGNIFIRGTQDANGVGFLVKAGDRQDAYAQVGHGGYGSRSGVTGAPFGLNGDIDIEVGGHIAVVAGTSTKDNPAYIEDGRLYAMIGHGGYNSDAANSDSAFYGARGGGIPVGTAGAGDGNWGHFGDITLVSTGGDISFMAGSNIPLKDRADYDGNPLGIEDPLGILVSRGGGGGRIHWAQAGHGGYHSGGNHSGEITVSANGAVHVVGGMMTNDNDATRLHYAQIGHGASNAAGNIDSPITVYALGGDLVVVGGEALTNTGQIGHGGTHTGAIVGDLKGDIKIIAQGDLLVNSGNTNGTSSITTNLGKIGHGDILDVQAVGVHNGNIEISVGDSAYLGRAIVGHTSYSDIMRSEFGDTFIAVGRNYPYVGGPAQFVTTSDTVIGSSAGGLNGSRLRLYMPGPASNFIAEGTYLNSGPYTRTPTPDGTRSDEQLAMEHLFTEAGLADAATAAVTATFIPEGDYPFHGFGLYNLYYSGVLPPDPPVVPGPFDSYGWLFDGSCDSFFRYEDLFLYDGYDWLTSSLAYEEALEGRGGPRSEVTIFEEILDGNAGPRRHGTVAVGSTVLEEEDDEDALHQKRRAARKVGKGALTYYVYDPGTNRYSSYRVFGAERTRLSIAR